MVTVVWRYVPKILENFPKMFEKKSRKIFAEKRFEFVRKLWNIFDKILAIVIWRYVSENFWETIEKNIWGKRFEIVRKLWNISDEILVSVVWTYVWKILRIFPKIIESYIFSKICENLKWITRLSFWNDVKVFLPFHCIKVFQKWETFGAS